MDLVKNPDGITRFEARERLSGPLHAALDGTVRTNFNLGDYETASFAAMKAVEVAVRDASGLDNSMVGVKLMRAAFQPHQAGKAGGPLADAGAEGGEQEAASALFAGAMGAYKNPSSQLVRPLHTLLAAGEPVTVDQLAARADRPVAEIREALAAMPDTEYDAEGRIIGYGLTFTPTPHRYEVNGRTFYTWCALDTLAFPAILGHIAQVTSPWRATGEPVRLTAAPDGPTDVEPATAVVSLVTADVPTSMRVSFCNQVHFFAGADAAKNSLAEHPDAKILPVAEAFDVGRPIIEQILADDTASDCC